MKGISIFLIVSSIISFSKLNAQSYEWEFDKTIKREKEKKEKLDSTLVHVKTRWALKLSWGRWYAAKSSQFSGQLFQGPPAMNLWQLGCRWHFTERLFADFSIGFQLNKNVPQPDVFSIISGNNVRIEGYGLVFIPIELGVKYYFLENRFRPYAGAGIGALIANGRFTEVEGNINNGFTETDFQFEGRVGFLNLHAGFDYRLGRHIIFTTNFSYRLSNKFEDEEGFYSSYQGFTFSLGLTILL